MHISNSTQYQADNSSYMNNQDAAIATAAGDGGAAGLPCLKDWLAVLFECFVIITLGYLASRFKLISPQAKDLNAYLAKLALPLIIFLNIAHMEIQSVNVSFLICMLLAKSIIFISVTGLALLISSPTNFGYAGSLGILVTQSNDFALGYPLMKSLYGKQSDILSYLSLQAPIQLLIFNPLGIAMLEYEKSRNKTAANSSQLANGSPVGGPNSEKQGSKMIASGSSSSASISSKNAAHDDRRDSNNNDNDHNLINANNIIANHRQEIASYCNSYNTLISSDQSSELSNDDDDRCHIDELESHRQHRGHNSIHHHHHEQHDHSIWSKFNQLMNKVDFTFILSLITNPLIIASIVALIVNQTYGPILPKFIFQVTTTIAASFPAPALFVIGLSMFGKFQLLIRNTNDLILSLSLVVAKLFILPNLMRLSTVMILPHYVPADESKYLINFSYLYGCLPTAPTAVLIAQQYSVLTDVVSISMLLSTVISAPLLLGVALIINPTANSTSIATTMATMAKATALNT